MLATPQEARNGRHLMRFSGRVLGSASSARADAPRWSELTVYGLDNGSYIRAKIGRSVIAHRPDCSHTTHRMIPWADLDEAAELAVNRVPCLECQPDVRQMDPQTLVEVTLYQATMAHDAHHLARMLVGESSPARLPRIVDTVIRQLIAADPPFATYWQERQKPRT